MCVQVVFGAYVCVMLLCRSVFECLCMRGCDSVCLGATVVSQKLGNGNFDNFNRKL